MACEDRLTKDVLWIFVQGEERPGFTLYSYWLKGGDEVCEFPLSMWPADTMAHGFRLTGENWVVLGWDVEVNEWPSSSDWRDLLLHTCKTIARYGARVVWCGLEGFFADPPSLFDPSEMSGGVWCAFAPDWGFKSTAILDGEFKSLSDSDLLGLRTYV
jgi:hypothetical protein